MKKKKILKYVSCFFVAALFSASITTVDAAVNSQELSLVISGSLQPHPILADIADCGFVASNCEELSAYAKPFVHTGVPLAEPGQPQQGQGLEVTVFLEEQRPVHPEYRLQPSLITYHFENDEWTPWVHTFQPIPVFADN